MKNISNNSLSRLKNQLEEQKKELEARMLSLSNEDPFQDNERLSDNAEDSDAVEQFDHERIEAMQQETERSLHRVNLALNKIEEKKYGICDACGKEINVKRLEIDPAVPLCIQCQEIQTSE